HGVAAAPAALVRLELAAAHGQSDRPRLQVQVVLRLVFGVDDLLVDQLGRRRNGRGPGARATTSWMPVIRWGGWSWSTPAGCWWGSVSWRGWAAAGSG